MGVSSLLYEVYYAMICFTPAVLLAFKGEKSLAVLFWNIYPWFISYEHRTGSQALLCIEKCVKIYRNVAALVNVSNIRLLTVCVLSPVVPFSVGVSLITGLAPAVQKSGAITLTSSAATNHIIILTSSLAKYWTKKRCKICRLWTLPCG